MQGPRPIQESEMSQLIDFLDNELRPNTDWSIRDEYPTTFNSKNAPNLFIIEDEEKQQVLTVSEHGFGKRTAISEWRAKNRGGKGNIAIETSERNGAIVKICLVEHDHQVMVITDGGQLIRTRVKEIRETGRNTQGVRVIRLKENEKVVDVEPVAEPTDAGESLSPPGEEAE